MNMTYSINKITLDEACETRAGCIARTALAEDAERGVPEIQLRDLHGKRVRLSSAGKDSLIGKLGRYLVQAGDVLFRSRGENNTVGIAIGDPGETPVGLLPLMVIKPKKHDLLSEFVTWSVNQHEARRHLRLRCARNKASDDPASVP